MAAKSSPTLKHEDYMRLADFRHALRCFLEFSETAAAGEGLTPQQHQALLVIMASPEEEATVGRLAERLRIKHHSAVQLAQRLEASGMILRHISPADGRAVILTLTKLGATKLKVLSHTHRAELRQISPQMLELFQSLAPAK